MLAMHVRSTSADRCLDGWNTLDTDNNEKKAGQEIQETAVFFIAAVPINALGRVPAVDRRAPDVGAVAYPLNPSHRSNPSSKSPRGVPSGSSPNSARGVWETDSRDSTDSTEKPKQRKSRSFSRCAAIRMTALRCPMWTTAAPAACDALSPARTRKPSRGDRHPSSVSSRAPSRTGGLSDRNLPALPRPGRQED